MVERAYGRDFQQNSVVGGFWLLLLSTTNNCSNVTDVFKTPGKMRGKTPRTNRKRNISESRVVSFLVPESLPL